MKNNILTMKKKELLKVILNSKSIMNKSIILELVYNNYLDNYICKITTKEIHIKCPTLIKSNSMTGNEQFIRILDNFITYSLNIINNTELINNIISLCIKNDKNKILLTKKYFSDNKNIKFFNTEFNKMIVSNFYNNCQILKTEINDILIKIGINIDEINLENYEDLKKLVNLLEELCFVNRNRYGVVALFEVITNDNYNMFSMQYELLLTNYYNNREFIKEYRKFKEKTCMYI